MFTLGCLHWYVDTGVKGVTGWVCSGFLPVWFALLVLYDLKLFWIGLGSKQIQGGLL